MDKDTQKTIKLIKKAKGDISFILDRLESDIEGISHKGVNFAPDAVLSPVDTSKPPF